MIKLRVVTLYIFILHYCYCPIICGQLFTSSVHNTSTIENDMCAMLSLNIIRGRNAHWNIPHYQNATSIGNAGAPFFIIALYGVCRFEVMKGNTHGGVGTLLVGGGVRRRLAGPAFLKGFKSDISSRRSIPCYFSSSHRKFGDVYVMRPMCDDNIICAVNFLFAGRPLHRGHRRSLSCLLR